MPQIDSSFSALFHCIDLLFSRLSFDQSIRMIIMSLRPSKERVKLYLRIVNRHSEIFLSIIILIDFQVLSVTVLAIDFARLVNIHRGFHRDSLLCFLRVLN